MNLQDWREQKKQGEAATLPSGLEIRIRRVAITDLAEQGKIPATLTPQLNELMAGGKATVTVNQFTEYAEIINLVCRACIVEPAELDIMELDYADRLSLFQWANEVTAGLQTFRPGQAQPVGVGRNGSALRAEAEQFHRLEG